MRRRSDEAEQPISEVGLRQLMLLRIAKVCARLDRDRTLLSIQIRSEGRKQSACVEERGSTFLLTVPAHRGEQWPALHSRQTARSKDTSIYVQGELCLNDNGTLYHQVLLVQTSIAVHSSVHHGARCLLAGLGDSLSAGCAF